VTGVNMPNTSAAERCYDLAAQVPHPTAGRALGHLAVLALRYTSGVRVLGIRYFSSPSYTHSRHWRLERREIRLPRRPGLSALLSRAIDYLRSLAICPALSVHDRWPARHPEALRPDVISRTMSIAPGTAATAPDAPTNP